MSSLSNPRTMPTRVTPCNSDDHNLARPGRLFGAMEVTSARIPHFSYWPWPSGHELSVSLRVNPKGRIYLLLREQYGPLGGVASGKPMQSLLCVLALLYAVFAVGVGLTVMQIAPSERGAIDLVAAIATADAFLIDGWLLFQIAVALGVELETARTGFGMRVSRITRANP